MRCFEELSFGRGRRAGRLNGYDVAGGILLENERPSDVVCYLETWIAMMIKANTPIAVRMFSRHRNLCFTAVSLFLLLWINISGFSLLRVPSSRFMYSISRSLYCK